MPEASTQILAMGLWVRSSRSFCIWSATSSPVHQMCSMTWSWAAPALVGNTSGAVGDLWVTALLVRFPPWAQVEDRTLGFAVWPVHGHSREEVRAHAPRRTFPLPAWISAWVLSTLAIFAVLPAAIGAVLGRTGQGPTVREMNFGLVFVVAAAVAGALVLGWARWRRWRRR